MARIFGHYLPEDGYTCRSTMVTVNVKISFIGENLLKSKIKIKMGVRASIAWLQ